MKAGIRLLLATAAVASLAACSEKSQTGMAVTSDAAPYVGSGSNFTAPGWTPGDKATWERELKARMQYGQNEYTRIR